MRIHLLVCALVLGAAPALAQAAEAFPWSGEQRLTGKDGALVWTVTRGEKETVIKGSHPRWTVEHRCANDGTPRVTLKTVGKRTSRLVWTAEGVEYTWDMGSGEPAKKISEKGLWDGDTLDARLAGLDWAKRKKVEFRIVDTEKAAGEVVPMKAEHSGDATCPKAACYEVTLRYDGFGSSFVAPWIYRYAKADGAYQHYEHEKEKFSAK